MKQTLLNPFEKYAEIRLFILGIIMALTGSYIAYSCKGRFDGIIDFHQYPRVQIWEPFAEILSKYLIIKG